MSSKPETPNLCKPAFISTLLFKSLASDAKNDLMDTKASNL